MQKTMSLAKLNMTGKVHMSNVQTEELIADCRSILTPSQRVEEKLAACTGFTRTLSRRDEDSHSPRRPR